MKVKNRIITFVIAFSMLLSLCSCENNRDSSETNGIIISDEDAYSSETVEYATDTVLSLAVCYYEKNTNAPPPKPMLEKLSKIAKDIVDITLKEPVSETLYRQLLEKLEKRGAAVITELIDLKNGGETSLGEVKAMYLALTSLVGADYIGGLLYDITVYFYEYRYSDRIEKFQNYGYAHYEAEAKRLFSEKETLVSEIGKDNFTAVLGISLALSELFFGGAFETDKAASFTNDEILLFIRSLGLSSLSVSAEGWELIALKAMSYSSNNTYVLEISEKMRENGDARLLGEAMADFAKLLPSLERMTADDVALIRQGSHEEAVKAVFRRFGDSEWECVGRIGELEFNNAEYNAIATTAYGEDYTAYLSGLEPITLEQLRDSVEGEDFYSSLYNYIAGICPAICYFG